MRVFHWIDCVCRAAEAGPYIEDRAPVGWRACLGLWLAIGLMTATLVAIGVATAPHRADAVQKEAV